MSCNSGLQLSFALIEAEDSPFNPEISLLVQPDLRRVLAESNPLRRACTRERFCRYLKIWLMGRVLSRKEITKIEQSDQPLRGHIDFDKEQE